MQSILISILKMYSYGLLHLLSSVLHKGTDRSQQPPPNPRFYPLPVPIYPIAPDMEGRTPGRAGYIAPAIHAARESAASVVEGQQS